MNHAGVIALAGSARSGKTSAAAALSRIFGGAPVVSFGATVRHFAAQRAGPVDRSSLQRLGRHLREELGEEEFCQTAMHVHRVQRDTMPVIWDGVRHVEVVWALREIYRPTPVRLVVLVPRDADASTQRLAHEAETPGEFAAWVEHESESHLTELLEMADAVVRASSAEEAARMALEMLGGPGSAYASERT